MFQKLNFKIILSFALISQSAYISSTWAQSQQLQGQTQSANQAILKLSLSDQVKRTLESMRKQTDWRDQTRSLQSLERSLVTDFVKMPGSSSPSAKPSLDNQTENDLTEVIANIRMILDHIQTALAQIPSEQRNSRQGAPLNIKHTTFGAALTTGCKDLTNEFKKSYGTEVSSDINNRSSNNNKDEKQTQPNWVYRASADMIRSLCNK